MPSLLKRVFLLIVFLLLLPLLGAWFYLAQPTFQVNSSASVSVDPLRLEQHVRKLSEEFAPRNYLNPGHLNSCADYIQKIFAAAGANTEVQSYKVGNHSYQNIIAHFGGSPGAAGRWIIGAHYDSCSETPGADDNASGIAGLLELARLLGNSPHPPAADLVAYTLEEPPFFRTPDMGSARHARLAADSGIPVKGAIILEMIGYFDGHSGSQEYPLPLLKLFYPSRGNFLLVVGHLDERSFTKEVKIGMKTAKGLPVYSINAPVSLPGIDFSDHLNYWAQNIPAVMITDTAFYRNKAYHGLKDTPDRLDYPKMAAGVEAVYRSLLRLEELEK